MPKRIILLLTLLCCIGRLSAQIKSAVGLDLEAGVVMLSAADKTAAFLNIEPKVKSSKNTSVGLRFGAVINSQSFESIDSREFEVKTEFDHGFFAMVATFDYYWNDLKYRPYLGIGAGPYLLSNYVDITNRRAANPSEKEVEVKLDYRFGALLRGGMVIRRLRLGLDYNFVPKADINLPDGQTVGTARSSYLGLALGITIGDWQASP